MRNAALVVFILLLSAGAFAMTCESSAVVQRTSDDDWEPVFLGRVTLLHGNVTREADGKEYGGEAELKIEKRFWGVPNEVPEKVRAISMEGFPRWTLDAEYLVVGNGPISKVEGEWTVAIGGCTPTRSLEDSRVGLRTIMKGFCDKPGGTIVGQLWVYDGSVRSTIKRTMVWISDQKGKVTIATTDDDGIYAAHHLPAGTYQIRAAVPAEFTLRWFESSERDLQEPGECVDGSLEFQSTGTKSGNSQ